MEYKEILESLGYRLMDNGESWRTSAVYRKGGNHMSVSIFKDSGIWVDFGVDEQFKPFDLLVRLTAGENSDIYKQLSTGKIKAGTINAVKQADHPTMEKTYPVECLERLLPHFKFYTDKGYSKETLKFYRGGLSMTGNAMSNRFVFPIFNDIGSIHGFNGRTVLKNDDKRPKWKLMGKKQNFVYPVYLENSKGEYPILEAIEKKREVLIIESGGDSMRCYENNWENHVVSFGVSLSSAVKCLLNRINDPTVIIGTNNDKNKGLDNTGLIAAIKIYLDLTSILDTDKIKICLPVENDFGDMDKQEHWDDWNNKLDKVRQTDQLPQVLKWAEKLLNLGKIQKKYLKTIKKLKNEQ